jgi:hypothetical protein
MQLAARTTLEVFEQARSSVRAIEGCGYRPLRPARLPGDLAHDRPARRCAAIWAESAPLGRPSRLADYLFHVTPEEDNPISSLSSTLSAWQRPPFCGAPCFGASRSARSRRQNPAQCAWHLGLEDRGHHPCILGTRCCHEISTLGLLSERNRSTARAAVLARSSKSPCEPESSLPSSICQHELAAGLQTGLCPERPYRRATESFAPEVWLGRRKELLHPLLRHRRAEHRSIHDHFPRQARDL